MDNSQPDKRKPAAFIKDTILWPQDVFEAMEKARGQQSRRSWLIEAVQKKVRGTDEHRPGTV